jgi:hypothetical protein
MKSNVKWWNWKIKSIKKMISNKTNTNKKWQSNLTDKKIEGELK